jgi:hypothetical protein
LKVKDYSSAKGNDLTLSHEAVIYVGDDEEQLSVGSGRLSEKADPSEAEASS